MTLQSPPLNDNIAPGTTMAEGSTLIGISEFFRIIRRRVTVIAMATIIALILAFAYIAFTPTLYTSSTRILLDPREKKLLRSEVVPSGYRDNFSAIVESQIKLIASETVLRRVVLSQKLASDPEFTGRPGLLERLRRRITGPAPAATGSSNTLKALSNLRESIRIKRPQATYVIEVYVTTRSPEKSARVANAIARAFLEDQADEKTRTTRFANRRFSARLAMLRQQVREAEEKIQQFRKANNLVTVEGELVGKKQLARLNEQLVQMRVRTAEAKAKYDRVRSMLRSGVESLSIPDAARSNVITRLREQYAVISRQAADLEITLGARHPRLLAVRAQLDKTRRLIRTELRRVAEALRADYEIARDREVALKRNLDELKSRARMTDEAWVRLRELQREANARQAVFQSFLIRARETSAQINIHAPDARIISPATPPLKPSAPKKRLVVAFAFLAGLAAGLAIALVQEQLARTAPRQKTSPDTGRSRPSDPAGPDSSPDTAGRPPLQAVTTIPWMHRNGKSPWTVPRNRNSSTAQPTLYQLYLGLTGRGGHGATLFASAIRTLAARLGKLSRPGYPAKILITSQRHGEGKAALVWSLGLAASMMNGKVLIIDADSDRPELTRTLAGTDLSTFAGAMSGHSALEHYLVHDKATGLDLLPLISFRDRPASPAAMARLKQNLGNLARQYDLVLIAGGPLDNDPDVHALAETADRILLVAGSEADLARATAMARPYLRQLHGIILSLHQTRRPSRFMG